MEPKPPTRRKENPPRDEPEREILVALTADGGAGRRDMERNP